MTTERVATRAAIVLTAVRIVLSTGQRPHYYLLTPHDDGNYVERALMLANGRWATRFDQYTFIRGPLYPLYLAAVSRSGLALPLVDVTLQCAVSAFLAYEIATLLHLDRLEMIGVYLSLFFLPIIETLTGSHVIRDNFAQLLLLAILAVGLRALRTRLPVWTALTALGVGLMAIVREDALWLIPWGLAIAAVYVVRQLRAGRRIVALVVAVSAVIAYWAPGLIVTRINSRSGLDSVTLFDEAHFVHAHQALARYINDGTSSTFTLTPQMFDSLTQRSPALAHLADGFRNWQLGGGIIYVDALRFGLADGLALAGDLADPSRRDRALDAVSDEIDGLCKADRRPACGAFAGPPPIPVVRFTDVLDAAARPFTGLRQLLLVEGPPSQIVGADGPVELLQDWARATNTSPPGDSFTIDGDTVHFSGTSTTVSSVFASAYLTIGRLLSPLVRVVGILSAIFLIRRRQWKVLALGAAMLACAYLRAAEVALAEHFLIGDFDFHYVQPAATLVHVTALIWLGAAVHLARYRPSEQQVEAGHSAPTEDPQTA
jgi:hypothetical protein